MVAVSIQNFAIDATDILGIIAPENAELAGTPFLSADVIAASFTDGRAVTVYGYFQPAIDALPGGLDAVLDTVPQLYLDAFSTTVNGIPYVDMWGIDLRGEEILGFLGSQDLDGGVSYVLSLNDTVVSGPGDDTLRGFAGDDVILGSDGNDAIYGDDGQDELYGNRGFDFMDGGFGADFVRGGQEGDYVDGGEGDDWHLNGNNGDDTVLGGNGNDNLFGGRDQDALYGEAGDDWLSGDLGDDTLDGGFGGDIFLFRSNGGVDLVADYFPDEDGDVFAIEANINGSGIFSGADVLTRIFDVQGGSFVDLGAGNGFYVAGRSANFFLAGDFFIV
ncbi:MAG: hypothetical protein IT561_05055 [Alphaproteobacteria bacterium]|nr:hypothetical protein [Alphaproteobacteria bacterium]